MLKAAGARGEFDVAVDDAGVGFEDPARGDANIVELAAIAVALAVVTEDDGGGSSCAVSGVLDDELGAVHIGELSEAFEEDEDRQEGDEELHVDRAAAIALYGAGCGWSRGVHDWELRVGAAGRADE